MDIEREKEKLLSKLPKKGEVHLQPSYKSIQKQAANISFERYQQEKDAAYSKLAPWDKKTLIYVKMSAQSQDQDKTIDWSFHYLIKANTLEDGLEKLLWTVGAVTREDILELKFATLEDVMGALRFAHDVTEFENVE